MIERHVTFTIRPGMEAEFEGFVRNKYAPTLSRQPGCSRVNLLKDLALPQQYQISSWFKDKQAAEMWRTSADHNALSPDLKAFYSDHKVVFFEVVVGTN